jgi:hypothetical protein
MKKNLSISRKYLFIRTAALVLAVVMLLSAAACNQETPDVSSEDSLTVLKVDELDQDMIDFLTRFTDWYEVEEGQKPAYDNEKAGNGSTNILRSILGDAGCADWSKYPVSEPKDVYNNKKLDPKKWAKESGGAYKVFDSKGADWIAVNIFNATEKDIEAMRTQGEENKWFYLKGSKYYKVIGGVGDPLTEYQFDSAKTDGTVYYVNYSCYFNNGEERSLNGSYSAEVQQKTVDEKQYWTLNKFEQTSDGE